MRWSVEPLHERLAGRRETTLSRFIARHGHAPASEQRAAMALFPGRYRNPAGTAPVTYQWFHSRFSQWADELDIGRWVAHQARHTLATSLLRHGASLTHIRRYLGHVSDRMAEHYIQLSHSDLDEHQDVQSSQQHRVHVQKVDREDPGGLGVQELPPGRA